MTAPTETVVEAVTDEPVEIIDEQAGEMRVRFPVLVIEGLDTSDGRFIEAGALTHRALPLSLLAQTESAHGGDDPGPAIVIGRIDSMTRVPGPDVVSRRTGEPFPDGTFIWQATGAIDAGSRVADLVRRGYLRGVSVDLVGMDYDIVGEDGFLDEANPQRQLITHSAEIAAATLVPIPAFGDAYVELEDEDVPPEPLAPEDLPEELMASAVPAWRSAEVGDDCGLCLAGLIAAADEGLPVRIPPDSVAQLAAVIDSGEDRDAEQLATAIVEHIAVNWALTDPITEDELPDADDTLTVDAGLAAEDTVDEGIPEAPQPCQFGPEPAIESIVFRDGDAYVPVCAEHRQQALDELAAAGEIVDEIVPIEQPAAVTAAAPTAEERRKAAEDGDAIPDGSFPITNGDELDSAIRLAGNADDPPAARRHIMRRAKDLGLENRIPDTWKADGSLDESANTAAAEALADIDEESVEVDEEVGIPDAPQPCEYGDHPAVRSLLFRGGEAYVPVCDEHEPEARERLDADGEEITGVVDIEQPDEEDEEEVIVAAGAVRPPAGWFADPQLDGPTPLTVDEDGRIRGHAAVFGTCHISFPQQCVTAPRSRSGYAYFATGAVLTDDGEVPVGSITMDTGHAPTSMARQAAAQHYDHTGAVVADVAVGEDAHGIWVAGALRADVDEHTAARLRASALSGDWRRVSGGLELVALLAVNVPGFPVPRARVASGEPQALVAAGALRPSPAIETLSVGKVTSGPIRFYNAAGQQIGTGENGEVLAVGDLADAIAARLEQRQQAGQLSARHAALVAELDDSPDRAAVLLAELDDTPQRAAELLAALDDDVDPAEVEEYISRMPAQLQREWLAGGIAARIAWGTPGSYRRCLAEAESHGIPERMQNGLCANLYHQATGRWPGGNRD